jgi:hypothetical protein
MNRNEDLSSEVRERHGTEYNNTNHKLFENPSQTERVFGFAYIYYEQKAYWEVISRACY